MKNSTGLDRFTLEFLLDLVRTSNAIDKVPPILGLVVALKATLKYLRRNRTQADIADDYGVSQPTISRAVTVITPMLGVNLQVCALMMDSRSPR